MANGMQLLTGHQAVNHISAADEAGLNTALITGDNVVIANEREITCEADLTGTLTVGAFVALFSGRKVACAGATGTYTQPSAGMYRRVSVGVLYTKNTQDDDVEDCDLAVYTSAAESASQSTAAGYDTGKPSATAIESETTEAYFELFDLVVSTTEIVTKTPVYSVFAGEKNEHARVDDLVERMDTAEDDIDTLQGQTADLMPRMTSAESAISNLQPRMTSAESAISNLQPRMTAAESDISSLITSNRKKPEFEWLDIINSVGNVFRTVEFSTPNTSNYVLLLQLQTKYSYTSSDLGANTANQYVNITCWPSSESSKCITSITPTGSTMRIRVNIYSNKIVVSNMDNEAIFNSASAMAIRTNI